MKRRAVDWPKPGNMHHDAEVMIQYTVIYCDTVS